MELREVTLKITDRDHTTPKYVDEGVPIISPTNLNNDGELDLTKLKLITKEAHKVNQKKTDLNREILFSQELEQVRKTLSSKRTILGFLYFT